MKKQYLIGILGIAAISVPMGNSLLTVNNSSSIPTPDSTTMVESGVAITESSISFYDLDQDGEINKGDSIAEVNIEGTIGSPEDGYEIDQAGNLYIYDASEKEPGVNAEKYSITKLIVNDNFETSDRKSSFTFNKEATADGQQYLVKETMEPAEDYAVAFALDMKDVSDGGEKGIGGSQLGSVDGNLSFNSGDLINNFAEDQGVKAEEVMVDKDASTASITYDITLLSDVDFATEEITAIEWIDLGEDGLLDEEVPDGQVGGPADPNNDSTIDLKDPADLTSTNGTLTRDIVPEEEYNKSLIRVTTDTRPNNTIESNIVEGYDINTVPPVVDDDNDKMGGGAIFGIIVAVALGVGIIGYGAYYLYKKYAVN